MDAYIICSVLRDIGYSCVPVESIDDAYACLRGTTQQFDAFIVDFQFKGRNSTDLIVELKESPEFIAHRQKPLILATSVDFLNLNKTDAYRKYLEALIGRDIIYKKSNWRGWLRTLVTHLITRLGDSISEQVLSAALSEEKVRNYLKIFPFENKKKNIEIVINNNGISSIIAQFSESKTLEQAMFEIQAQAIRKLQTDKEFINLSNVKKAEIIGVHRIKYARLINEISNQNRDFGERQIDENPYQESINES